MKAFLTDLKSELQDTILFYFLRHITLNLSSTSKWELDIHY